MIRDRASCLDYCDQPSYHHVDDLGILMEVVGPHINFRSPCHLEGRVYIKTTGKRGDFSFRTKFPSQRMGRLGEDMATTGGTTAHVSLS